MGSGPARPRHRDPLCVFVEHDNADKESGDAFVFAGFLGGEAPLPGSWCGEETVSARLMDRSEREETERWFTEARGEARSAAAVEVPRVVRGRSRMDRGDPSRSDGRGAVLDVVRVIDPPRSRARSSALASDRGILVAESRAGSSSIQLLRGRSPGCSGPPGASNTVIAPCGTSR